MRVCSSSNSSNNAVRGLLDSIDRDRIRSRKDFQIVAGLLLKGEDMRINAKEGPQFTIGIVILALREPTLKTLKEREKNFGLREQLSRRPNPMPDCAFSPVVLFMLRGRFLLQRVQSTRVVAKVLATPMHRENRRH